MTKTSIDIVELLQKHDQSDFLRTIDGLANLPQTDTLQRKQIALRNHAGQLALGMRRDLLHAAVERVEIGRGLPEGVVVAVLAVRLEVVEARAPAVREKKVPPDAVCRRVQK